MSYSVYVDGVTKRQNDWSQSYILVCIDHKLNTCRRLMIKVVCMDLTNKVIEVTYALDRVTMPCYFFGQRLEVPVHTYLMIGR